MKESYRKEIANHPDLESCVCSRKAADQALAGAQAGGVGFMRQKKKLTNRHFYVAHPGAISPGRTNISLVLWRGYGL